MEHPEYITKYVLDHFISLFEAPEIRAEFSSARWINLNIPYNSSDFFNLKCSYSPRAIFKTWKGQLLPFFFDENDSAEIISEEVGKVTINYDIISSAFYLLSGWQEYYSEKRDKFGRFPYEESIQNRYNFITTPIVNYYFDILKTALEKTYGIELKKRNPVKAPFTVFLSHDIDRLESAWKIEGIKQLKQGNYLNFARILKAKLTGKDHWNNLDTVTQTAKKYGATSTFFWLANNRKSGTGPNADYAIEKAEYQKKINQLQKDGFEIGVHGSFGSSGNAAQLKAEVTKINAEINGNRFHYLCYNPKETPEILANAGLIYDSTLGFPEHFGFRNSYCFPFYPFDFKTNKACSFMEIPLNLMDTTLWHPNYLQVPPNEILPEITPMLQEIEKFGGVFGLLWHNENFSELNKQNGLNVFEEIMQYLKNRNSAFLTGSEIVKAYTKKD